MGFLFEMKAEAAKQEPRFSYILTGATSLNGVGDGIEGQYRRLHRDMKLKLKQQHPITKVI
jgi:hypothetical protein